MLNVFAKMLLLFFLVLLLNYTMFYSLFTQKAKFCWSPVTRKQCIVVAESIELITVKTV